MSTHMAGTALFGDADDRRQTVPNGPNWWSQNAVLPGNTWILPSQATQHETGDPAELNWQYPFFRQDLVDAGLLPQQAPLGAPKEIEVPQGMSVLKAIEAGLIR